MKIVITETGFIPLNKQKIYLFININVDNKIFI